MFIYREQYIILVVVGVHSPAFDGGKDRKEEKKHAMAILIEFPCFVFLL